MTPNHETDVRARAIQLLKDFYSDRCRYSEHASPFETTIELYESWGRNIEKLVQEAQLTERKRCQKIAKKRGYKNPENDWTRGQTEASNDIAQAILKETE